MKNRKFLICAVFVFLTVVFTGTVYAVAPDRNDTLIVANYGDVTVLDPIYSGSALAANLFLQVYDYLIFQNPDGSLSPRLAESWEQPDDKTYILHLKKGVKFHNGEPFTAEDAIFTINRGRTSVTATASNVLLAMIEDVKKIDDYTISVHLNKPFTPFLYVFSEVWGGVVCKKVIEEIGSEAHNKAPIGTGPFKFMEWRKGDRVVLDRNDDYHGQKAEFERLIIRAVPEDSVRTIELESGAIDMAYQVHVNDFKRIEEHPKLTLMRRNALRVQFFVFNCKKEPLGDVRVRQALVKAVDAAGLQRGVYRGIGYAPAGPLPRDMRYSDRSLEIPKQDVEGAKKLLADAGAKNLKLTILTNEQKDRVDAATILQEQFSEIGVEAEIQVLEYGAYDDKINRGDYDIAMYGWGNNLPDPEFALTRLFHTRSIGASNISLYSNPKMDELLDKGVSVPEGDARAAVYKDVQKLFLEEVPAFYWSVNEITLAYGPRIEEFPIHIRGIYELNKVKHVK
jgi:peptide/nickel transport system substrate-binding protein